MKIKPKITTFLSALFLCAASDVLAATITNSTGISSPQNVITFEEVVLPRNTPMSNQYAGLGVTFSTGLFYDGNKPNTGDGRPNMSGRAITNFDFDTCLCTTPFSIKFVNSVSAAAFAMVTEPGSTLFEAKLNGSIIESFTAATNLTSTNNFYGFQGITFDEIRVTRIGTVTTMFDNIQFNPTAVPEPATLAIFGISVATLALSRRRRRVCADTPITQGG